MELDGIGFTNRLDTAVLFDGMPGTVRHASAQGTSECLGDAKTGLHAGDALLLAIAANHGAKAIDTLDKTMLETGRCLGLPVSASGVVLAHGVVDQVRGLTVRGRSSVGSWPQFIQSLPHDF